MIKKIGALIKKREETIAMIITLLVTVAIMGILFVHETRRQEKWRRDGTYQLLEKVRNHPSAPACYCR